MALKDLVADRGKVAEGMIETIISGFVRYELNPNEIVFTPEGAALNNDAKVLIYLVAALGWQYVIEEKHNTDTKPADLEETLGIPGGTLRPVLKKLKDAHLLTVVDGHYSIRPSNLDAIGRAARGEKSAQTAKKVTKKSKARPGKETSSPLSEGDTNKTKKKSGVPIRSSLDELIGDGFFNEFRTLGQVSDRLHEQAIIAKVTSLSGPAAEFVRDKKLQRKKIENKGKQVWAYKAI
ncbi:MAG: hypothetical protein ISR48_09565 [Alphaproteobacteria bacterium]|nr:hypothetical protein [Alphaproteobacteria bacterium]